jgi:hypothetical protein
MGRKPLSIPAQFCGLPVVMKEGMMRTAWFIRDAENRILSSGVIGMGVLETPGADAKDAAKIECGSSVFAMLLAHPHPAKENEGHG